MLFRLQIHGTIYRPDPFLMMLRYCATLKPIRYESTSLNRIVADKSHRVIIALRRISCHGRNYSQPYFFKRNQSSDNRSHGFGAKFLLKKLSASDFSYERKSAFRLMESRTLLRAKPLFLGEIEEKIKRSQITQLLKSFH